MPLSPRAGGPRIARRPDWRQLPVDRAVDAAVHKSARFPQTEAVPTSEQLERHCMKWMLRGDTKPSAQINELELVRQLGIGTQRHPRVPQPLPQVRVIEKRPNSR